MSIIKKPLNKTPSDLETAANLFIAGAPDAVVTPPAPEEPDAPRRVRKGKKVQISLTISEPLLDQVDELAAQIGQSRAAVINLSILQMLKTGVRIDGAVVG